MTTSKVLRWCQVSSAEGNSPSTHATHFSLLIIHRRCIAALFSVDSNRFKSCRHLMAPPIVLRTKVRHNHCNLLPNLQLKRGAMKVTPLQPTRVRLIHRFSFLHLLSYEMTAALHFWWTGGFSFQSIMKTLLLKMLMQMHHCRRLKGDFFGVPPEVRARGVDLGLPHNFPLPNNGDLRCVIRPRIS
jgi:hypothetical protein